MTPRPFHVPPIAFFLLNACAVGAGLFLYQRSLKTPDSLEPSLMQAPEMGTVMSGKTPLVWEWDFPVQHPTQVGGEEVGEGLTMHPKVGGKWEWTSERTLSFTPQDPWPAAQSVLVGVDTVTTNRVNHVHLLRHQAHLKGPALQVVSSAVIALEHQGQTEVRLSFNAQVDLSEVRDGVEWRDAEGDRHACSIQETPNPTEFLIRGPLEMPHPGVLLVKQGLRSHFEETGSMKKDVRIRNPTTSPICAHRL